MHTYIYTYTHICIYTCICICIHIYTYIHNLENLQNLQNLQEQQHLQNLQQSWNSNTSHWSCILPCSIGLQCIPWNSNVCDRSCIICRISRICRVCRIRRISRIYRKCKNHGTPIPHTGVVFCSIQVDSDVLHWVPVYSIQLLCLPLELCSVVFQWSCTRDVRFEVAGRARHVGTCL